MFTTGAEVFDEGSVRVAEELSTMRTQMVAGQLMGYLATGALLVFAVGYYRLLQRRLPGDSMAGQVVIASLVASVGAHIVGYGLLASLADGLPGNFAYFFEVESPNTPVGEQQFPAETKTAIYWIATNAICYGWIGVIPAAAASAVAALKHGAISRWMGWFSVAVATIGVLMIGVGLPFGATFYGPLWLAVMGIGLGLSLRSPEASAASGVDELRTRATA